MPITQHQASHGGPGRHHTRPLIVRAGIARTFGSLGFVLALIFFGAGTYFLQEVLSNPSGDQSAGLLTGAFNIALAVTLIYYIFVLRRGDAHK
jgi:hypothetical protein